MGKIMYRGEQFPGGPNLLSELRDVNFSNIQDKQIILYDSTSRTWKNHTITAADVAYDENNSVAETISSLNSALTELSGRIKIEIGNVTTNISSGIANLRTDGKPIIYVTSGVDGWYYSLGRSGNIVWAKCFNYDGTVVSDRTGIAFYYYYLDNIT